MDAIVIPAYNPTHAMVELARRFSEMPTCQVVIVNDGSDAEHLSHFDACAPYAIILSHPVNRGKGAALRTAFEYIRDALPDCTALVTADADGQHTYEDIQRVLLRAHAHPDALIMGCRSFVGDVPFRSRFGNTLTRWVFHAASGVGVSDTQTGLRAFHRDQIDRFLAVAGDRYEYEINMLLTAAKIRIPIEEEPIETVYVDQNATSHFHPVRDSIRIYACILKFASSSLASFLLDYALYALFLALGLGSRKLANVCARVISASFNFSVNWTMVFRDRNETLPRAALKYAVLAAIICVLDTYVLESLINWVHIPPMIAKLPAEIVMFFVSYFVQKRFIFRRSGS